MVSYLLQDLLLQVLLLVFFDGSLLQDYVRRTEHFLKHLACVLDLSYLCLVCVEVTPVKEHIHRSAENDVHAICLVTLRYYLLVNNTQP